MNHAEYAVDGIFNTAEWLAAKGGEHSDEVLYFAALKYIRMALRDAERDDRQLSRIEVRALIGLIDTAVGDTAPAITQPTA